MKITLDKLYIDEDQTLQYRWRDQDGRHYSPPYETLQEALAFAQIYGLAPLDALQEALCIVEKKLTCDHSAYLNLPQPRPRHCPTCGCEMLDAWD